MNTSEKILLGLGLLAVGKHVWDNHPQCQPFLTQVAEGCLDSMLVQAGMRRDVADVFFAPLRRQPCKFPR